MASRSRRLAELLVGGAFFAWGCAHCAARGHSMLAVVGVALGAISHAMHAGEYVDGLGRYQDVRSLRARASEKCAVIRSLLDSCAGNRSPARLPARSPSPCEVAAPQSACYV